MAATTNPRSKSRLRAKPKTIQPPKLGWEAKEIWDEFRELQEFFPESAYYLARAFQLGCEAGISQLLHQQVSAHRATDGKPLVP